jgi:hypothetical protein
LSARLIRARTGEGRSRAKARGVRFGRPPMRTSAGKRSSGLPMARRRRISRVPMPSISRIGGGISAKRLGWWLRGISGRVEAGYRLNMGRLNKAREGPRTEVLRTLGTLATDRRP